MKMILKVEVFAQVETQEVSASDLKRELYSRITRKLKGEILSPDTSGIIEYKTIDGRKLKATVKWLFEDEAYNSLK